MGIILGLLSGFFDSLKNISTKNTANNYSALLVTSVLVLVSSIITLPLTLIFLPTHIPNQFIIVLLVVTLLDFFAFLFYTKSIHLEDLSLTLPMLSFTPLFVFIISFIFFGQTVSLISFLGIILILIGGYILQRGNNNQHYLQPLQQIVSNKGIRYMLYTSILWGITNSLHKRGIQLSNPFFYSNIRYLALSFIYIVVLSITRKKDFVLLFQFKTIQKLSLAGVFESISTVCQFLSQYVFASSVLTLSLKRSSILFSALLGSYFYNEPITNRILPICIILIGIICLSL
jgi:drug/metabolite transporter (DMT)-like permease